MLYLHSRNPPIAHRDLKSANLVRAAVPASFPLPVAPSFDRLLMSEHSSHASLPALPRPQSHSPWNPAPSPPAQPLPPPRPCSWSTASGV